MTRKRKTVIVLLAVAMLLIAARVAMPYLVEDYANDKLAALNSYDGHVGDIDIHLWRGAYSIDDIEIVKTGASRPVPFFRSDRVDLSIEWRSLFRGSIVSEASFLGPELNLVQGKGAADSQLGKEENWNARLEELFPFRFNTIEVTDGTVRFLAPGISTSDAITARHVNGDDCQSHQCHRIRQGDLRRFQGNRRRARGCARGGGWQRECFCRAADLRRESRSEEGAAAAGESVAARVHQGRCRSRQVRAVHGARGGRWKVQGLRQADPAGREHLSLRRRGAERIKRVWEGFLDFAANVFENQDADQVAARIPFSGTLKNPETNLFATIASVMRNAFISAFARSLEGSITLRDVKKNLGDIDPDKDDKKKDSGKEESGNEERAASPGGPAGKVASPPHKS